MGQVLRQVARTVSIGVFASSVAATALAQPPSPNRYGKPAVPSVPVRAVPLPAPSTTPSTTPAPVGVPSAPAQEPKDIEAAKEFFRQGIALAKADDYQRALEYFLRSRAIVASVPNTLNAAVSLRQLGRFDEALELFEELLTKFRDDIGDDERATLAGEMSAARGKVGSIDLIANVDGMLVIDGRQRGKLPLLAAVRVLPGRHVVQVIKEGFGAFRSNVDVKLGQTTQVDAKLEPLAAAGRVRVDGAGALGAQVRIDGANVGTVPWEGTLSPGPHLFSLERGNEGSAPKRITVVLGQTVTAEALLAPLGEEQRVLVEPASAELMLDGVPLGSGRWQGRLPIGGHALTALEEGYVSGKQSFQVTAGSGADVTLKLVVNEAHARWNVRHVGEIYFDAIGAGALASSFGSGAEASCSTVRCSADPLASGYWLGARIGYELWFGLGLEAIGGYLQASKTLERSFAGSFTAGSDASQETVATNYAVTDTLRLSGPIAGLGLGYRRKLGKVLQARADVAVGALFAAAADSITGNVTASGSSLPVVADGSGAPTNGVAVFVLPQLTVGARFENGVSLGVGFGAAILFLDGPAHAYGDLGLVAGSCDGLTKPTAVDCVPGNAAISRESAYGPTIIMLPTVTAGYAF